MHYVIGDVHGCFKDLMKLLDKIEEKDKAARFIFVGDFIDRGPDVWETLEWAKGHVTKTGKYRSVMGNHEKMIIEWYPDFCRWYEKRKDRAPVPMPMYDFLERVIEQEKDTPECLRPYVDFFRTLPLQITVRVPGKGRKRITYDIVHAFVPPRGTHKRKQEAFYLWDREKGFEGNFENDHVIVHGHTPTVIECSYVPGTIPGMISYRRNAVNVDGGCVFAPNHPESPCMLCALCLENLEEIYPYTLEERMQMQLPDASESIREALTEQVKKEHQEYLRDGSRAEILRRLPKRR